jgi:hypothetical protein
LGATLGAGRHLEEVLPPGLNGVAPKCP